MNNYFCLNYVVTKEHPSGITIQAQGSCGLNISNDIKKKVDLFMDHNINRILRIQQGKNKKNSWEEVEKKIGITFPEDYKLFIDSYGEGNNGLYFMYYSQNRIGQSVQLHFAK